jgi:pimeloyl-ACP methyl ester carboxylesterase
MFERELNKNPWQQHNSEYMIHWSGFLNEDEPPLTVPNSMTKDLAARRVANIDWLQDGFKSGRFSETDREKWMRNYELGTFADYWYLANRLNPPYNQNHAASQVKSSWTTKYVTENAKSLILKMPTLVFWGVPDIPLPTGNLTGFDHYFTDVKVRMYPGGGHDPMQRFYREVNQEIRDFISGKDIPKEAVYRAPKK